MNLNLKLLKFIPLILLIVGLLEPTKIAKAASFDPINKDSKQESLTNKESTEKPHNSIEIPQLLLSKQAQQIEFFSFLAVIGFSIVIPELFYNSKKSIQSPHNSEAHKKQKERMNKIEENIIFIENPQSLSVVADNSEKFKNKEKSELKNQSDQEQKAA